jgi:hypothetical protein
MPAVLQENVGRRSVIRPDGAPAAGAGIAPAARVSVTWSAA